MKHAPRDEVYWYTLKKPKAMPLDQDLEFDIVIIGGGMAGLMCAQHLKDQNKNLKVCVIESSYCGAGASGKSSGFITPDSELELSDLVSNYGEKEGKRIWEFVKGGVKVIRDTIERRSLACDYSEQDSLFIANNKKGFKKVSHEHEAQQKLGYSSWLYDNSKIEKVIGTPNYEGAVRYKDTYGIIAYLYCQELKESLQRDGMLIYEETKVKEINAPYIKTENHTIKAEKIVICTDRFLPEFNHGVKEIFHAQTFLAVTKPLAPDVIRRMFPDGPMMVWDTDLIYQYYRIVEGNRLLIGAASLLYTYAFTEKRRPALVQRKMEKYLAKKFPYLRYEFDYMWPGFIGVSKDFLPIVGKDPVMKNVYFTGAGAGLPWAAALGEYIAEKIIHGRDDFDELFAVDRKYPISKGMQVVLSTPVSFAISHGIKKYFH